MINSRHTFFLYTALWAALALGCFFMSGCENEIKQVQELGQKTVGVEEAKNIESYLSQGGKMKAKLVAPLMLRYQLDTPKIEFPKTMHVDFFDDKTTVESQLNAKYGRYYENQSKVFLRDSVVIFNRNGDTLWTNEMYWDQIQGIFYSDKPATMVQQKPFRQLIFAREGFRSDQNFRNVVFFKIENPSFTILPDSTY